VELDGPNISLSEKKKDAFIFAIIELQDHS
jgi:hypothetical protein